MLSNFKPDGTPHDFKVMASKICSYSNRRR